MEEYDYMEKLIEILSDIRPDLDFYKEDRLVDDSIIDSFDIITAVSEINETFSVGINIADLIPENLNSATSMWDLIIRHKQKKGAMN